MSTLQHRFILASASPRRAELLTRAGYEFDVVPVDVDERRHPGESASGYVIRLAVDKASAVATTVEGQVVVGADTTVLIAGKIFGKPQDPGEAAAMLRQLSGCTHEVLTGVAVRCGAACLSGVEVTRVSFAELEDDVIAWYVDTGEPLDKAGAYGGAGGRLAVRHPDRGVVHERGRAAGPARGSVAVVTPIDCSLTGLYPWILQGEEFWRDAQ